MSIFDDLDALANLSPPKRDGKEASLGETGGTNPTNSDVSSHLMSARPNIFGGTDFFNDGIKVGHTTPNIFGGIDYHNN